MNINAFTIRPRYQHLLTAAAFLLTAGCGLRAGDPMAATSPAAHPSASLTGRIPADGATRTPAQAVRSPTAAPTRTFIAELWWSSPAGVRTLTVVPAASGRATRNIDAAWQEVVKRAPGADSASMREQFLCHAIFASAKPAWHLEPARPAVGLPATVSARCNPGTVIDIDAAG